MGNKVEKVSDVQETTAQSKSDCEEWHILTQYYVDAAGPGLNSHKFFGPFLLQPENKARGSWDDTYIACMCVASPNPHHV